MPTAGAEHRALRQHPRRPGGKHCRPALAGHLGVTAFAIHQREFRWIEKPCRASPITLVVRRGPGKPIRLCIGLISERDGSAPFLHKCLEEGLAKMFPQCVILSRLWSLLIVCALLSWPAYSQPNNSPSQAQDETTVEGTVVASSHTTFVVRSDDNHFHVFTIDPDTNSPQTLAIGKAGARGFRPGRPGRRTACHRCHGRRAGARCGHC